MFIAAKIRERYDKLSLKILHLYSAANCMCYLSGAVRHRQGWRSTYAAAKPTNVNCDLQPYAALVCRFYCLQLCNLCIYMY